MASDDFRLHRSQGYVFEHSRAMGVPVELLTHEWATRSCEAKAELLSERFGRPWALNQVVKALYFHPDELPPGHYVGVITPETGMQVDFAGVCGQVPALAGLDSARYAIKSAPRGMSFGTCTPFPYDFLVEDKSRKGFIDALVVLDFPELEGALVDISLGGNSESARRTSMHVTYGGIYDILCAQFPGAVSKAEPRFQ